MLQNVRVDIIYYQTDNDFEMEFNLGGCCRTRTLHDKATDRKGLIKLLARAVSRSQIIMICGGLFSETGLIETVATAIGKGTSVVDNAAYGINAERQVNIISGSTPLVTPEGYFGGCIIESGPQTIILLSENKGIRKTIMQKLIHPYLEAYTLQGGNLETVEDKAREVVFSENENTEEPVLDGAKEEETELEPEGEAVIEEQKPEDSVNEVAPEISGEEQEETSEAESDMGADEVSAEEPAQSIVQPDFEQDDIGFVFEDDMTDADEQMPTMMDVPEDEIPMHLEPEKVKYSKTSYYEIEYTSSEEDKMFLGASMPIKKPPTYNVPIIVLISIVGLLLCVIAYFLIVIPLLNGQSLSEYFSEIFTAELSVMTNLLR